MCSSSSPGRKVVRTHTTLKKKKIDRRLYWGTFFVSLFDRSKKENQVHLIGSKLRRANEHFKDDDDEKKNYFCSLKDLLSHCQTVIRSRERRIEAFCEAGRHKNGKEVLYLSKKGNRIRSFLCHPHSSLEKNQTGKDVVVCVFFPV